MLDHLLCCGTSSESMATVLESPEYIVLVTPNEAIAIRPNHTYPLVRPPRMKENRFMIINFERLHSASLRAHLV